MSRSWPAVLGVESRPLTYQAGAVEGDRTDAGHDARGVEEACVLDQAGAVATGQRAGRLSRRGVSGSWAASVRQQPGADHGWSAPIRAFGRSASRGWSSTSENFVGGAVCRGVMATMHTTAIRRREAGVLDERGSTVGLQRAWIQR